MKVNEFNTLTYRDKIVSLLDSRYLTTRIEKGYIVNLYELYGFFVEEFYDCQKNRIITFKTYLADKLQSKVYKYDLV